MAPGAYPVHGERYPRHGGLGAITLLPASYIFALAGLAIVSSLQDALARSFSGEMAFGALVAFVVATTPFAVLGITSAFWAIVAGLAASFLVEGDQLVRFWSSA